MAILYVDNDVAFIFQLNKFQSDKNKNSDDINILEGTKYFREKKNENILRASWKLFLFLVGVQGFNSCFSSLTMQISYSASLTKFQVDHRAVFLSNSAMLILVFLFYRQASKLGSIGESSLAHNSQVMTNPCPFSVINFMCDSFFVFFWWCFITVYLE